MYAPTLTTGSLATPQVVACTVTVGGQVVLVYTGRVSGFRPATATAQQTGHNPTSGAYAPALPSVTQNTNPPRAGAYAPGRERVDAFDAT